MRSMVWLWHERFIVSTGSRYPGQPMYLSKKPYTRDEVLFLIFASAFSVLLVLTNIVGVKLFLSPWRGDTLTTGIITYPLTFWLTDVVSEIWGKRRANFMVIIGFGMSFLMLAVVQIALHVNGSPAWVAPENRFGYEDVSQYQNAFESVFAINGKLLFGSMLAYMCAQLWDVRVYHTLKRWTKGKHLWLRNNGSTMTSQLIDTAIVNSILFYWGFGMEFWLGVEIMLTIYIYKMILAAIDTPFIYLGVHVIKRYLGLKDPVPEPARGS